MCVRVKEEEDVVVSFFFFCGGDVWLRPFLYGNPLFRVGVQQLSKKAQLPSLAVPPECYSRTSSAPNRKYPRVVLGKEEEKKGGSLILRQCGMTGREKEKQKIWEKDLGRGKIRNPYRPYRSASTLGSRMKRLSNLKHTIALIPQ